MRHLTTIKLSALAVAALLAAAPAFADAPVEMPKDVTDFLARRADCARLGLPVPDMAKEGRDANWTRLKCDRVKQDAQTLSKKYAANQAAISALDEAGTR